jgi:capsular exopolysaccharide synthesis family protein
MAIFNKQKNKKDLSTDTMDNGVMLITEVTPKDVVSEQFRSIRTNVEFSAVDKEYKTLIFTSSNVSEGKSTVSANTAVTWAQQGKKVLFIDADLRRPTLHATFGLPNNQGLTNVLTNKELDYHDVIKPTRVKNLSVLTSGPVPPNPSELLNSDRMKKYIELLKGEYDLIIFDVPPMLQVTDTQIMAAYVDGVILVVRQGVAQQKAVTRSIELLEMVHANLLGYVMNDVASRNGYGYGYGYGYGETK